jgi:hypothetical protein
MGKNTNGHGIAKMRLDYFDMHGRQKRKNTNTDMFSQKMHTATHPRPDAHCFASTERVCHQFNQMSIRTGSDSSTTK